MIKSNNIFRRFVIGSATFALTAFLATINDVPNAQASENASEKSKIAKNTNLQKDTSKDEKQDGTSYQDNIQQLENNVGKIEHASKKEYKPLEPISLMNGNDQSLKIKAHEHYTKWMSHVETKQPKTFEIGDFVWEDANKNGRQDKVEKGISDVEILLKDRNFKVIKSVITDSNGRYLFKDLPKGLYFFKLKVPNGYEYTISRNSVDGNIDSDGPAASADVVDTNQYWYDFGLVKKDIASEPKPEFKPEPKPQPEPEVKPESKPESDPEIKSPLEKIEETEPQLELNVETNNKSILQLNSSSKIESKSDYISIDKSMQQEKQKLKVDSVKMASKELPKTGKNSGKATTFASLLVFIGSFLLFRRKLKMYLLVDKF